MSISGKYFPSQVSGERVFLLIRRHWIVFASMIFFVVVLLVPVFILIFYMTNNPEVFSGVVGNFAIIFGGIYTLTVFGLILFGFVNYYLDVYIVTNKRIVDIRQKGFFRREIAELHLHQVQDVEARVEGVLQTMMHFGNVHIQTAAERENFVFEDVPHPYTLAKQIVELHEAQLESEYEPKKHHASKEVDDYRPEDYINPEDEFVDESAVKHEPSETVDMTKDDDFEGGIKYLEEEDKPRENIEPASDVQTTSEDENFISQAPVAEYGFGSNKPVGQKNFEEELNELSEGEEVSLNGEDREL